MEPFPLDHVAVAVPSLEESALIFELLSGKDRSPVEELEDHGVNVAWVGSIELLEPRGRDTPVGRFLARQGPGLHHVAYRVSDLPAALARLRSDGFRLVDSEPRRGARGHRVAFVHPDSTDGVLVELVER